MSATELTPIEAQAVHDRAEANGTWIMWFVGAGEAEFFGKVVAWAVIANSHGGTREPGYLAADTLEDLRAKLPAGLFRRNRTPVMSASVLETWD